MTLSELLIPTFRQTLTMLDRLLDKAAAQGSAEQAQALMSARIAADMYPLAAQVRLTVIQALEAICRLRDEPKSERMLAIGAEVRNSGDAPGTLVEARAVLAHALEVLGALGPDALDAGADRAIALELPNGMAFDMTGDQYARDWALPQFYFHAVTAYAILRHQGIEIGKIDYMPHMLAYMRPQA